MASCLQKIPSGNESRSRKEKMMKWVFQTLAIDGDWITHNTNLNPLLNLLINCISARSAPTKVLSIKGERTFLFSNFLIIGLCNLSANGWFDILSFLILLSANFYPPVAEAFLRSLFNKKVINHWTKFTLISIVFHIFSNIKCFITHYFVRSCFSN